MKILIVAPKFVQRLGQYYNFPVGLAYISSALKKAGFDVECLNLNNFAESTGELVGSAIREHDIDIVMTGGLSAHYHIVKAVLDSAKSVKPGISTVIGGGLLTSEPELMMGALKADYGVLGEGELTVVELAGALHHGGDFSGIEGIIYPNPDNGFTTTPPRKPISDLGTIPFPDYEGLGIKHYLDMQMQGDSLYSYYFENPREMSIISSRSCPYDCTFCFHPLGRKFRQRSLDDFFAEVEYLKNTYDINQLIIFDELFTLKKERFEEFCDRISQYDLKYAITLRVDCVTGEILSSLKKSGCFFIGYGIESASNNILKSMKKNITVEQINDALKLTRENQIAFQGNLLYSDPAETVETFNESVDWWKNHRDYHVVFWPISPYPGTRLYLDAVERGLIEDKLKFIEDGCQPINLTDLGDEFYQKIIETIKNLHRNENRQFPKYFKSRKVRTDKLKGDVFHFELKCPHCNQIVEYKNFNNNYKYEFFKLYCRNCHQRFDIAPWDLHQQEFLEIFSQANKLIFKDDTTSAYTTLLKLQDKFPSNVEGRVAIATAAAAVGDFQVALEQINSAIWLRSGDPKLHNLQGIIYFRSGNKEMAKSCFLDALNLDMNDIDSLKSLAVIENLDGNTLLAQQYLNRIIELDAAKSEKQDIKENPIMPVLN